MTFPTTEQLKEKPMLHVSDDGSRLRLENHWVPKFSTVRFWTREDNITNDVTIEVREYVGGEPAWYDLATYDGKNPPEFLTDKNGTKYCPEDLGM